MTSSATVHVNTTATFAAEVSAGLNKEGQKELPPKYFYDEVGSALFEVISLLPEYGLTRADERLLRRHAGEIVSRFLRPVAVAELGSGTGKKTRWILEKLGETQPTTYYPIEVSPAALSACRRELGEIGSLQVVALDHEYLDGLTEVAARRPARHHLAVLFLGSAIGNFNRAEAADFLQQIRKRLLEGDALLLGTDLEKPVSDLLAAYDDPAGVTAAFNLNLLARINRDLEADFNLRDFRHEARFNEVTRSIEMHLRSVREQVVQVRKAAFSVRFDAGETIWTESSRKYSTDEARALAENAGFRCEAQWVDPEWAFAESLFLAE